ncbi:MAG: hypothetical protein IJ276_02410 [Alphaproteobacteria bacterium]|nr:hypothetical protein [Alphaproteobacteria bacterium]MBR2482347.1 hypothetical protein [Alphaproteobacteria bacterium]
MKAKASVVAQKLLNLYRQEHVIIGGWGAINPIFIDEADDEVIQELAELPTGKTLIRHINNLRSGKTPMDSIERELMPYGGAMDGDVASVTLSRDELSGLADALNTFTPDERGLAMIEKLGLVKKFGAEWLVAVRAALSDYPELAQKWSGVAKTYRAYQLWNVATEIVSQPIDDRKRAEIQADMPEFETYLPMFGDAGNELLNRLRLSISSAKVEE